MASTVTHDLDKWKRLFDEELHALCEGRDGPNELASLLQSVPSVCTVQATPAVVNVFAFPTFDVVLYLWGLCALCPRRRTKESCTRCGH